MNLYSGLEAISFQSKSKLASNLISIFEEVFVFKNSLKNVPVEQASKMLRKFFIKTSVPKIQKAVKAGTGFNIKEIKVSKRLNLSFACSTGIGDPWINGNKFMDEYSGLGNTDLFNQYLKSKGFKCVTAEDIQRVTESLNKDTGIFKNNKLKNGSEVYMTLYFDPFSAYFIQELLHNKCEPFTSEELTAIVLHEIGHVHSCFERALDGCYRGKLINDAVQYITKHVSKLEQARFIEQYLRAKGYTTVADKLHSMIDKLNSAYSNGVVVSKDNPVLAAIATLCSLLLLLMVPAILINTLVTRLIVTTYVQNVGGIDKTGDFRTTTDNLRLIERLADEFCIRHGMGQYLITGLDKLELISPVFFGTYPLSTTSSTAWWTAYTTMCVLTIASGLTDYCFDEHDPNTLRFKKILENTLTVFKNSNIDPELRSEYITIYEETLTAFNNRCFSTRLADTSEAVWRILDYISETPLSLIGTGRFQQEYINLVDRTNKLINNALYYRAAKLEEMVKQG